MNKIGVSDLEVLLEQIYQNNIESTKRQEFGKNEQTLSLLYYVQHIGYMIFC
jgi:hypothetical protein